MPRPGQCHTRELKIRTKEYKRILRQTEIFVPDVKILTPQERRFDMIAAAAWRRKNAYRSPKVAEVQGAQGHVPGPPPPFDDPGHP